MKPVLSATHLFHHIVSSTSSQSAIIMLQAKLETFIRVYGSSVLLSFPSSFFPEPGVFFFCRCRARLKLRRSSIHLVLIGDSPVREKRWDSNLGVTNKHKKQDSKPQHKQPKTQNRKGHLRSKVKHYAFWKVWKPRKRITDLFFTVVLEPNIHTFSVLSETLPDFLKSKLC